MIGTIQNKVISFCYKKNNEQRAEFNFVKEDGTQLSCVIFDTAILEYAERFVECDGGVDINKVKVSVRADGTVTSFLVLSRRTG